MQRALFTLSGVPVYSHRLYDLKHCALSVSVSHHDTPANLPHYCKVSLIIPPISLPHPRRISQYLMFYALINSRFNRSCPI